MDYFKCRISKNKQNSAILNMLNSTGQLAFEHFHESGDDYNLDLTTQEITLLKSLGIPVEQVEDLEALAEIRKQERAHPDSDDTDDALSTGFTDHYMDTAEVDSRITTLAAEFPTLTELTTLPHSTSGYDGSEAALTGLANVRMLRITNTPAIHSRPGLLLICGTHAREWVNPLIAIEFAEQLLRNYNPASTDPDVLTINRIVEGGDIFIVPVMNPDGLNYSFHDSAGWRKNRRPNPGAPTCPGVDNNRNYEVYFSQK